MAGETSGRNGEAHRPYAVVNSGRSLDDCLADVHRANYHCYGPDDRLGAGRARIVVDTLASYERLIAGLAAIPHMTFLPHAELHAHGTPAAGEIVCSIRHDVDSDIAAAVAEAEIERAYGVRTTYYILHTASYYGLWREGVFHRNECMAILYRRLAELEQEVGLHTDALGLYLEHGMDGADGLRAELEWLRSEGVEVCGTVAHNSAAYYGAENFAVFTGRNLRRYTSLRDGGGPDDVIERIEKEGRFAPLGVMDEAELGLTYEGNEFFWLKDAPLEYGATRALNRWRWNAHNRRMRAAQREGNGEEADADEGAFIDQDRLLREIAQLPTGCRLILNVHPLYYGQRHAELAAPLRGFVPGGAHQANEDTSGSRPSIAAEIVRNGVLGWETYRPGSTVIERGDTASLLRKDDGAAVGGPYEVVHVANELGMLDHALSEGVHRRLSGKGDWRTTSSGPAGLEEHLRLLLLGGTNLDGRAVGLSEQAHRQTADRLAASLDQPVEAMALAFPDMGLSRLAQWMEVVAPALRPQIIVLGVGADVIETTSKAGVRGRTGFDPAHPPGHLLEVDEHGRGAMREPSRGAMIRRGMPRPIDPRCVLLDQFAIERNVKELEEIRAMLGWFIGRANELDARLVLLIENAGETSGAFDWRLDAERWRSAHEATQQAVGQWAEELGLPVADPYPLFFEAIDAGLPPCRPDGRWSETGHRLAARALRAAVEDVRRSAG